MAQKLMILIGILALLTVPIISMAKSHNGGHGGSQGRTDVPAPNPSAYEHADDKAKFLRDSHDMGKHQGQEMPKGEGQEKAREQDRDKDRDKNQSKGDNQGSAQEKDKDKSKEKSRGSADQEKGKGPLDKQSDLGDKPKGGKAK